MNFMIKIKAEGILNCIALNRDIAEFQRIKEELENPLEYVKNLQDEKQISTVTQLILNSTGISHNNTVIKNCTHRIKEELENPLEYVKNLQDEKQISTVTQLILNSTGISHNNTVIKNCTHLLEIALYLVKNRGCFIIGEHNTGKSTLFTENLLFLRTF